MAHQQESSLPFSSRQSLSCCLSRVAKRSTPKPHGPLYSPSEPCGPLPFLQNSMVLPIHSRTVWPPIYFRTSWSSSFPLRTSWFPLYLLASEPLGPPIHSRTVWPPIYFRAAWSSPYFTSEPRGLLSSPPKPCGPPPSMAAAPRFKSQRPSSFAAPFPTPPTVSYTCQHPCILPALLGCHSKSGQVWPHGMEPIISKLSHRPCNQGELLPSPILGGIWSHPPGSKHGHSYLTHP